MEIGQVFPKGGQHRDIYCDACGASMDLTFPDFSEDISGVRITILDLPHLQCPVCGDSYLTDGARFAIIELHKQAIEKGSDVVRVTRNKRKANYKFSDVPFLMDADDYFYIPGLYRPYDTGFLTPIFFEPSVLIKFDNSPDYNVTFASQSYGTIETGDSHIPFGINRQGKLIMWLGDIAKLPESEQFYLRSENVESDHSIGSEFYDAQIECKFTDPTREKLAVTARSELSQAFELRFNSKLFHLDDALISTIANLRPPVVDTEKERKHIFDSLNRVFLESIDNSALEKILKASGTTSTGSRSLKRLQAALETIDKTGAVPTALMPMYVLYDLRVAYSHLTSTTKREEMLSSAATRLRIAKDATLSELYETLVDTMTSSLRTLTTMLN